MAGDHSPLSTEEIVRRSGSNLAFALAVLPREKRADMRVFYAFCRVIDDIADSGESEDRQGRVGLNRWEDLCDPSGTLIPEPGLEREFVALRDKYRLPSPILKEIIAGVRTDLEGVRFDRVESLMQYCFRVAGAVGLISIEIFGYQHPGCRDYAEKLGYALQWTNILRDVGEDAAAGRIYLPLEDLRRFGLSEEEILGRIPDDRFLRDDGVSVRPRGESVPGSGGGVAGMRSPVDEVGGADAFDLLGDSAENEEGPLPGFREAIPAFQGRDASETDKGSGWMKQGAGRASTGTWERCWEPALRSLLPCSAPSPIFPSHAKSSARDPSA